MKTEPHAPAARPLSEARSADLRNAPAAMARAVERVRVLAKLTNTYLVVQQSGRIVKLKVD